MTIFFSKHSCTAPYNADTGGGEMNLHFPQSVEARVEILQLAMSTRMLITPQTNRPAMAIKEDTLTGLGKLTKRDVFLTKASLVYLASMQHLYNYPLSLQHLVLCLSIEGLKAQGAYSEQARAEHDVPFKHRSIIFRLFYIFASY